MNEQKVADFFAAHDREIADNGFSQRVIRRVSKRGSRFRAPLVFAVAAATVIMAVSAYIITTSPADFGFAGVPYLSIGIVAVVMLFFSLLVADVFAEEI